VPDIDVTQADVGVVVAGPGVLAAASMVEERFDAMTTKARHRASAPVLTRDQAE
jgi:hypothetical protein